MGNGTGNWFCLCVVLPCGSFNFLTTLQLLFHKRWPGVDGDLNLFFMGVFKMGWWIGTFAYFAFILQEMGDYPMMNIFFMCLNLTAMSNYIYLTRSNPGILNNSDPDICMDVRRRAAPSISWFVVVFRQETERWVVVLVQR